jgi:hypothetical protein
MYALPLPLRRAVAALAAAAAAAVMLALAVPSAPAEAEGQSTVPQARRAAPAPPDALARLAQDMPVSATPWLRAYAPPTATRYLSRYATEEKLLLLLRDVPEVDLEAPGTSDPAAKARERLLKLAQAIKDGNGDRPDGFIADLARGRPDLAGLPLQLGGSCKLGARQAHELTALSAAVRTALDGARLTAAEAPVGLPAAQAFWANLRQHTQEQKLARQTDMMRRAVEQVVLAEHAGLRLSVVQHLRPAADGQTTVALARRAVFDPDDQVRGEALAALADRPGQDYRDVLLGALRYPWPPVAQQAAEAIARLKPRGTVAPLVRLLDEPDPDTPFVRKAGGKDEVVRRELVRVNHLRNCLLCHAPSSDQRDPVRSVVPVPGEPVPSSFGAYLSSPGAGVFVRADITYLRQDFSVPQPVEQPGTWPARQRYDYVVRTRPLTAAERTAWEARGKPAASSQPSPYRRAVLYALCALTGEYAGPRAADWRRLVPGASGKGPGAR